MVRPSLRLLHTSDLHLGANRDDPDHDVLRSVLRLAAESQADAILMAGDVFDNNRIPQGPLDEVVEDMASSPVPIVILPGNHDCLLPDGVYDRGEFGRAGVTVLGVTTGEIGVLDNLGVTIWGRPHRDHKDLFPLRDVPSVDPGHWRVNMAHGHWVQTTADEKRAYRITEQDLETQVADYLALGHWDRFVPVRSRSPAFYSGSPRYSGGVNLVVLSDSAPAHVSRVPIH